MCDHYDSYYRETYEEAQANLIAAKREAARVAEFKQERLLKLAREYKEHFSVPMDVALIEVQKIQFVIDRR